MKKLLQMTALCVFATSAASANEFENELKDLAAGKIAAIVAADEVVAAVKAQNGETAGYDQAKIDELDKTWRAEADAIDQPMIDKVMENPLSVYLADIQEANGGLFTEIFVMDAKGLNVGQSEVTSDYWQGDEDKWQKTYSVGADGLHIGRVIGIEHDAGLPRVERGDQRGEEASLTAGDDLHLGRAGGMHGARAHPLGDGAAQRRRAGHRRVAQIAALLAVAHGV